MALDPKARQTLQQHQRALQLTDKDVGQVETSLQAAQQQRQHMQYQKDLKIYEQMFLEALQRQSPLAESDRQELQYLQEVLQLLPADVSNIEARLTAAATPPAQAPVAGQQSQTPKASQPQGQVTEDIGDPASIPTQLQAHSSPPTDTSNQATMPPKQPPLSLKSEAHPQESATPSTPELLPTDLSKEQLNEVIALPPNIKDLLLRALLEKSQSHLISEAVSVTPDHPPKQSTSEHAPEHRHPQTDHQEPSHQARSPKSATQEPAESTEEDESLAGLTPVAATSGQPSPASSNYRGLVPLIVALATLAAAIGGWLAYASLNSGTNTGKSNANPKEAQQYANWGTQKMQQGQYEAAVKDFTQAVQLDPDAAAIYVNRGLARHRMGDLGAAVQDYDKAIALNPQLAEAYSNRSHVKFEQKQYEAALEDANSAVALKPTLAEARLNLANARLALNNPQGAVEDYTLGINLNPNPANQPGAYNNRGNALVGSDAQAAIGDYDQAIRLNSSYADAFRNRGLAYQKLGNNRLAIQDLQSAAKFYLAQGNQEMYQQTLQEVTDLQQAVPSSPTPQTTTSVVEFSQ